jgi:hypothetical protein
MTLNEKVEKKFELIKLYFSIVVRQRDVFMQKKILETNLFCGFNNCGPNKLNNTKIFKSNKFDKPVFINIEDIK